MRRTVIGFAVLVAVVVVFTVVRRSTTPEVTATARPDGAWNAATDCVGLPADPGLRDACTKGDGAAAFVVTVRNDADVALRVEQCAVARTDAKGRSGPAVRLSPGMLLGVDGSAVRPGASLTLRWFVPGAPPSGAATFTATCDASVLPSGTTS